jgi:hypothetical protein
MCHPPTEKSRRNHLRQKTNFASRFKLIWVVQSGAKKHSILLVGQIIGIIRASCSLEEGRWPSSRTLEREAVDATAAPDERR